MTAEWEPLWPDKQIDSLPGLSLDRRLRTAAFDPGRIVSRLRRRNEDKIVVQEGDWDYEEVWAWVARASEIVVRAWQAEQPVANTSTRFCAEEACRLLPNDFARLTLSTPTGAMTVEVLLCELHIATLEMLSAGQYLFLRPRRGQ